MKKKRLYAPLFGRHSKLVRYLNGRAILMLDKLKPGVQLTHFTKGQIFLFIDRNLDFGALTERGLTERSLIRKALCRVFETRGYFGLSVCKGFMFNHLKLKTLAKY